MIFYIQKKYLHVLQNVALNQGLSNTNRLFERHVECMFLLFYKFGFLAAAAAVVVVVVVVVIVVFKLYHCLCTREIYKEFALYYTKS